MKSTAFLLVCLFGVSSVYADYQEDANRVFSWAEQNFPHYFNPGGAETLQLFDYVYRYYSLSDTYLGLRNSEVYVDGAVFGGMLYVGQLTDFLTIINQDSNPANPNQTYDLIEYFPLSVGSYWMTNTYYSDGQNEINRNEILGTEIINDHLVYQRADMDPTDPNQTAYTPDDASLFRYDDYYFYFVGQREFATHDQDEGLYLLVPPVQIPRQLKVGDVYSGSGFLSSGDTDGQGWAWQFNFIAHHSSFSLSNGSIFNDCIEYQFLNSVGEEEEKETIWSCRGIGEVKYYQHDEKETGELYRYSIK